MIGCAITFNSNDKFTCIDWVFDGHIYTEARTSYLSYHIITLRLEKIVYCLFEWRIKI